MRAYEIGFAGFLVVLAALYGGTALRMPQGDLSYPGPGFFPVAVGVFFILAAFGCLVQALLHGSTAVPHAAGAGYVSPGTAQLLAGLLGYALTLQALGFPIALFAFTALAIRVFGYRRWLPVGGIALLLTVLSYVMFVSWFKVPLPMGLVGHLLDR